ncbi:LysR family transcriptional regulator [Planktotalea sp.]|uniref:LysR family transcriptional regulator n=1 Tax=Planktotalea sp. TaxID=2029877 RepID=UPI0025D59E05|nr:LysR family transcriptional regulator [Planktotalea sp.]
MAQNWDDLRIFLGVARGQSLSAAGKTLRIDPATVGRRIARLEQRMGTPLFAKSPLGYELSAAGARLLPLAEEAEQAMGAAGDLMVQGAASGSEISGTIRIGAPDGCANFLLPQVCARIVEAHPDLDVQIVALPRVVNLSKREADMAITVSAPTAGRLTVQKLSDYKLHLAASPAYLRGAGPLKSKEDLQGHRMIGYIPDMIFDKELDYLSALGVQRVPLASNSVAVQFHAIRQGAGLGIVHDFALPAAPELTRILVDDVSLVRSFYLVRHDSDRRLQRLNRFAEALAAGIRAEIVHLEAAAILNE